MADLSPAAQAVWEAFNEVAERVGVLEDYGDALAAALCAAATQLRHDPGQSHQVGGIIASRFQLLRIAAELEGK
jgi:hypothetical protein